MRVLLFVSFFVWSNAFSQDLQSNWVHKPFSNLGFIENKGLYDPLFESEILYHGRYGDYYFYFAKDQLIVGQKEKLSGTELRERHEKMEHGEPINPVKIHYFQLKWLNSNPSALISPNLLNKHTIHFQDKIDTKKTIVSDSYQELVYKNVYTNIDLRFILPLDGGLKYEFIVHPSGNPADIKLQFLNAKIAKQLEGNLLIESELDPFLDLAPTAWEGNSKEEIKTNYTLSSNNIITFHLENYDKSQPLIIDPWLVPALPFTDVQQGYDVVADFEGNCSVLGQIGNEIAHYDNAGTLEWVWLSPGALNTFYGGMDMNPHNGDTYYMFVTIFLGIEDVWRLNSAGIVTASMFLDPLADDPGELWRLNYNPATDKLVIGAGGLPRESHIVVVNGDLTSRTRHAPLVPSPPNLTDATFLDIDLLGEYYYLLCSGDAVPLYNNTLYKIDLADPATIIWEAPTSHTFKEISCIAYLGHEVMTGEGPTWYSVNGYNGIAVAQDIYTYDGDVLYRWNKATGALLGSEVVTPFDVTPYGDLAFCGGIDTDPCGNVYVGTEDSVIVYTHDLNYIEAYSLQDTCYDIRFTREQMFASGKNFVESWDFDFVDLSFSTTPQPCGFCEGTATIIPESDCSELEFSSVVWMPGGQTTPTATNLCAGWYTATVKWDNGIGDTITRVDSVEVMIGAPGTLIVDVTHQTCNAICNGTASISVIGGFAPFIFDLEGEINATGIYTDLCPGTYSLTVLDADSCYFTATVEIIELDSIECGVITLDESCEGACNGLIVVTPLDGAAPYVFEFNGVINPTGSLEDLCLGTYDVLVTDTNGCAFYQEINIITGEDLGLDTVEANYVTCYGFSDGSATVDVILGDDPVEYTWIPANPSPGATYNSMSAGIYTVYATDATGCMDTLVFQILQPDSIYATLTTIDPLCFGDATGIANVDSVYNAQGIYDNISFVWTPNYFGANGIGVDSAYNMPAGDYVLLLTDENGCANNVTFTISQPDEMTFSELGKLPAMCRLYGYQSGNGVVFAAVTGGVPDYIYLWGNLETGETTSNSTWGGLNAGNYEISVVDNNGCVLSQLVVLDSISPIAEFSVNSDQLDAGLEGTELVVASFTNLSEKFTNGGDPLADTTFFWNLDHPNASWEITDSYFYQPDTSYVGEKIYEVCLIALNKNGCADTTCKNLIVHVQPKFVAPNIFSPGGNGINDIFTFEFKTIGIQSFKCIIQNRWGVKVAELNSVYDGWNGTDLNGDDCVSGVYFYVYEAVSTNGTSFEGQGTVQLVRK